MQYMINDNIKFTPKGYCISTQSREIKLSEKETQVLLALCSSSPGVVPRATLLSDVWQDSYSSDSNLNKCILMLRRKLESIGVTQQSIDTIPRVGYAMKVPVSILADTTLTDEQPSSQMPSLSSSETPFHIPRGLGYIGLLLIVCISAYTLYPAAPSSPPELLLVQAGTSGTLAYTPKMKQAAEPHLTKILDKFISTLPDHNDAKYYALISEYAISFIIKRQLGRTKQIIFSLDNSQPIENQLFCAAKTTNMLPLPVNSKKVASNASSSLYLTWSGVCNRDDAFLKLIINHTILPKKPISAMQELIVTGKDDNIIYSFTKTAKLIHRNNNRTDFKYTPAAIQIDTKRYDNLPPRIQVVIAALLDAKTIDLTNFNYNDGIYTTELLGGLMFSND